MPSTLTKLDPFFDQTAGQQLRYGFFAGPASYVTGGETVTPEQLALGALISVMFEPAANTARTLIVFARYSILAKKLQWYAASGAEISNGTDLSTYGARFVAIGH